jgi:hypothetical protein
MIVSSVLLILVAVGLLVGGVVDGSNPLIVGSMAATVVAAIVLVVGVRQSADVDEVEGTPADNSPTQVFPSPFRDTGRRPWDRIRRAMGRRLPTEPAFASADPAYATPTDANRSAAIPTQSGRRRRGAADSGEPDDRLQTSRIGTESVTDLDDTSGPSAADATAADEDGDEYDAEFDDEIPEDEPDAEAVSAGDAARAAALKREVLVIDGRPRYHLAGCVHLLGRDSEPLPIGEAKELGFTPCALCEPDRTLLAEATPG